MIVADHSSDNDGSDHDDSRTKVVKNNYEAQPLQKLQLIESIAHTLTRMVGNPAAQPSDMNGSGLNCSTIWLTKNDGLYSVIKPKETQQQFL